MITTRGSVLTAAAVVLAILVSTSASPPISGRDGGLAPSVAAGGKHAPTILHRLDDDAMYASGCFPAPPFACGGPLTLYPSFEGRFGLTAIGIDRRGFAVFAVSDLAFVASGGDEAIEVLGTGVYRRSSGPDPQQEMVLFVTVDGAPALFDSGIVPVPSGPHAIDVSVDMNDLINYDTLMRIVADPR